MTSPPASTPTPQGTINIRHAAQHECGHAAASWALEIPFSHIVMSGLRGPVVYPVKGTRVPRGHDWVIKLCGVIADQQARDLSMRGSQISLLILGGKSERFEVDDVATGQVAVRPSRIPAVQPGGDLHEMAVWFSAMPRVQAAPEVIRLWRECESFAGELRPAVDALAGAVMERGQLSYSEASEIAASAMIGRPMPVLADWLR